MINETDYMENPKKIQHKLAHQELNNNNNKKKLAHHEKEITLVVFEIQPSPQGSPLYSKISFHIAPALSLQPFDFSGEQSFQLEETLGGYSCLIVLISDCAYFFLWPIVALVTVFLFFQGLLNIRCNKFDWSYEAPC